MIILLYYYIILLLYYYSIILLYSYIIIIYTLTKKHIPSPKSWLQQKAQFFHTRSHKLYPTRSCMQQKAVPNKKPRSRPYCFLHIAAYSRLVILYLFCPQKAQLRKRTARQRSVTVSSDPRLRILSQTLLSCLQSESADSGPRPVEPWALPTC